MYLMQIEGAIFPCGPSDCWCLMKYVHTERVRIVFCIAVQVYIFESSHSPIVLRALVQSATDSCYGTYRDGFLDVVSRISVFTQDMPDKEMRQKHTIV